jgi:hypothetical protein
MELLRQAGGSVSVQSGLGALPARAVAARGALCHAVPPLALSFLPAERQLVVAGATSGSHALARLARASRAPSPRLPAPMTTCEVVAVGEFARYRATSMVAPGVLDGFARQVQPQMTPVFAQTGGATSVVVVRSDQAARGDPDCVRLERLTSKMKLLGQI